MGGPSRQRAAISAEAQLLAELDAVAAMSLVELRAYWKARWGGQPAYRARDQICRAASYRLQAEMFGGLPALAKRDLAELAVRFDRDRGFSPGPAIRLKPGSALIREWGGQRHEVAVVEGGFVYQDERFASLSKLAQRITGAKWNGPVFFGLKPISAPAKAAGR
jgi:hypothetical protein